MKKMMKMISGLICATVLSGCWQSSDAPQKKTSQAATNRVDSVLVSFAGKDIKQSEVFGLVEMRLRLEALNRRMKPDQIQKFKSKAAKEALPFLVQSYAYGAYCATNHLVLNDERVKAMCERIARKYRCKSYAALAERMSPADRTLLEKQVESGVLIETAKSNILAQAKLSVSQEEIDAASRKLQHMNDVANATNQLVYAHATNIWRRIEAKELTLEEAAQDYSECEFATGDGVWGSFTRERLEDETALLPLLDTMSPGDITPPIPSDNGLAIVRLDRIVTNNPETFAFSRVYFRLAECWERPSEAEMRKVLLQQKESKLVGDTFDNLLKSMGFVDHMGDRRRLNSKGGVKKK